MRNGTDTPETEPRWDAALFKVHSIGADIQRPQSVINAERKIVGARQPRKQFNFIDMAEHNRKRALLKKQQDEAAKDS
jgi:hypothetical protein